LRMRRAADAVTESEQPLPEFPIECVAALREPRVPVIARAFVAVEIMEIAPVPRRQHLVFVRLNLPPGDARIKLRLSLEQPLKRRTRKLARIPRMIRLDLRIAHSGKGRVADRDEQEGCSDES